MAVTNEEVAVRLSATGGTATASEVGRVRGAVAGLEAETRRATASTLTQAGSLRTLQQATQGASQTLDRMVNRGAVGLTALTGGAVAFGLQTAGSFELSKASLGALMGSVSKGKQTFKDLQAYNLNAPFSFQGIADAEQTLIQMGVSGDKALTVLKGLGDVAALTTDPTANLMGMSVALGQISSQGKLFSQDLNQLTSNRFPAWKLAAEVTGKSIGTLRREMATGGSINSAPFVAAIEEMNAKTLESYKGGAARANNTLYGQVSNFKDLIGRSLAEGLTPSLPQIERQLPVLASAIGDLVTQVGPQLPSLIDSMIKLTPAAVSLAGSLADVATLLTKASASSANVLGPDGIKVLVETYLAYRFGVKPLSKILNKAPAASRSGTLADIASGSKSILGKTGAVAKWLGPLEIAALGKMAYRTRPGFLGGDLDEQTAGMSAWDTLSYQLGYGNGNGQAIGASPRRPAIGGGDLGQLLVGSAAGGSSTVHNHNGGVTVNQYGVTDYHGAKRGVEDAIKNIVRDREDRR